MRADAEDVDLERALEVRRVLPAQRENHCSVRTGVRSVECELVVIGRDM